MNTPEMKTPGINTPEALYAANQGLLWYCLRRLPSLLAGGTDKDHDDAEQIARLGLWEAAVRYDPTRGAAFSTWAYRWITGRLLRELRTRRMAARLPYVSLNAPVGDGAATTLGDCLPSPLTADGEALTAEGLRERLAALPERQQELLTALFVNGQTVAAVAEDWGCTPCNVFRIRQKALAALRKQSLG